MPVVGRRLACVAEISFVQRASRVPSAPQRRRCGTERPKLYGRLRRIHRCTGQPFAHSGRTAQRIVPATLEHRFELQNRLIDGQGLAHRGQ